jgi:hypothetical protein
LVVVTKSTDFTLAAVSSRRSAPGFVPIGIFFRASNPMKHRGLRESVYAGFGGEEK